MTPVPALLEATVINAIQKLIKAAIPCRNKIESAIKLSPTTDHNPMTFENMKTIATTPVNSKNILSGN